MLINIIKDIRWIIFRIINKFQRKIIALKRLLIRPTLPNNTDGKILIHLGCGDVNSPEFINVDTYIAPHIHYICDVTKLTIFPDNYADLIYACHVLEHIPIKDIKKVLWLWKSILKPGATLRLSVPDFDKIIHMYNSCAKNIEGINTPLMGYEDGYNQHCAVFNFKYLYKLLNEIGFNDVREWDPSKVEYHNFDDWASKLVEFEGGEYFISLNIEATK